VVACASTIAQEAIFSMYEALRPKNIGLIDAPVSGGQPAAEAGTLAIFTAGERAMVDSFKDTFSACGKHLFYLGKLGNGIAMKLINNMLLQTSIVAIAEAMTLGAKAGIDPQTIYDALKVSTGYSVALELHARQIISRDFVATGARLDLAYKDQELQTKLAKTLGVPLLVANVTQQVYQMAINYGLAGEDVAAVVKLYEMLSGVAPAQTPIDS
jgi:3-hydroxyisobutyrate dehydrogenase